MKNFKLILTIAIFGLAVSCTSTKTAESDDDFATDATAATQSAEPSQSANDTSELDLDDSTGATAVTEPPASSDAPAPSEQAATKDEFSDFDDPAANVAQTPAPSTTEPVDEFAQFDAPADAPPADVVPPVEANADTSLDAEFNSLDAPPAPLENAATPPPVVDVPQIVPPVEPEVASTPVPEVPLAPAPEPIAQIQQLSYQANQNGGAFTIQGDRPLQFTTRMNSATNQLVVEVQNSVTPERLKRPLNTKDMASSIGSVDVYQKPDSKVSRFVVQLRPGSTEPLVQPEGNSLLIIGSANEAYVAKQKADAEKLAAAHTPRPQPEGFTDLASDGIMSSQSLEEFLIGNHRYYGKKISIETNNLDVKEAIKFIAEESGANLLMDDGLEGKISLKLRQVPWDQALILILKAKKLGYVRQGNVLRIAKLGDLQTEEVEAYKLLESRRSNEPLIVKRFFVSYANLAELQAKIREFIASTAPIPRAQTIGGSIVGGATPALGSTGATLAPPNLGATAGATGAAGTAAGNAAALSTVQLGRVIADERTGTLIVTDTPNNMEKIEKLIAALDTQPKQVVVETRVINASESFSKSLGFNWNSSGSATSPNSAALGIKNQGAGEKSSILNTTFSWKNLDIIGNLDAIISLGEIQEKVKVLNTQRITVNSGKAAPIGAQSKLRIPITTTNVVAGASPTNTSGFDTITYGLKGTVLPQASNENTVSADIEIEQVAILNRTTGDTSTNSIGGRVVAQSGQTLAVNASFVSSNTVTESGVPGLREIPVLGMFFKGKSEELSKAETLVFVTMTILEPVTGVFKKAANDLKLDSNSTQ